MGRSFKDSQGFFRHKSNHNFSTFFSRKLPRNEKKIRKFGLLVDEAQDTSPIQWRIIDALTEDFFTDGRNKNDVKTLFVVGDKKQSIYSFQGSDVKSFHSSYNAFRKKLLEKNYPLTKLPLSISFRTSQDILDLVDAIFDLHEEGVVEIDEKLKHTSAQIHVGRIEIFPVLEKEKIDAKSGENIKQSVEKKIKIPVESRLAKKVVDNIKNLLDSKIKLPSTGKTIEPKDILILLQKRNPLAYPLAKFLKNADIPFEGLDKFTLKNDLAILDLLACLKFATFPYDDLNTASLLKSSFFNLSEKDIFEVCYNRDEKYVFEKVFENSKYKKTKNILKLLRENSTLSPFDFFSFILENLDGRHILLQNLGEKHAQPIEEFLTLAFEYSKNPDANLSEFLTYINSSNPAVKREFKKDSLKGIRLMSVHGAKGLEAPVVILPDTTRMQSSTKNPIFFDNDGDFFSTSYSENRNAFLSSLVETEKGKNLHESRRLLYVALTRPKDLLQVFGYGTIYKKSWYEIIKAGSLQLDFRIEKKHNEDIFIYGGSFEKSDEEIITKKIENETKREVSFLPKEREITIPESQNKSAEIGTKIHEVLDRLTSITAGKRQNFIEKSLVSLSQKNQDFWREKLNKICTGKYDFLFKKTNLSEREIITPTGQLLRIDNISFVNNEIWIVDYKTDDEKEKIPNSYKKQLQKYIYSVSLIYSNKKIRAFILWIETGKLHEL
ncbi:MAG: hypothetical protein B6I23_02900 [Rickettsiaceae bacterium 4572_127]|nr:MAG: hypothetical protein B6I23_02900 [Rickettsiaceae bacterium 4572_127]